MPPPCVLFEDDHLLVVNKPAGLNTHAPAPFAGEGLYEWLHHREPRWADLAIIHRLDKETSGVMVFGKTTAANRSLTAQFAGHSIRKKYLLIADRPVRPGPFTVVSSLIRTGEKYASRPLRGESDRAETRFRLLKQEGDRWLVEAEPVTGRTHQIRVHAAAGGFPILGDTLYGGSDAPRVCLHAVELRLHHPVSGGELTFSAPADFDADSRLALRAALLDARETDAFRILHGAADGWPGWYVDKLGDFLLSQGAAALDADKRDTLERLYALLGARGVYHKNLTAHVSSTNTAEASPRHLLEETAAGPLIARENGVQYELSFNEGYSVGLFLDQ